jgi:hypothetical protein
MVMVPQQQVGSGYVPAAPAAPAHSLQLEVCGASLMGWGPSVWLDTTISVSRLEVYQCQLVRRVNTRKESE